ncbi:hypothetical protein ONZ43_g6326 [Nemania bipapillata]|uniref:Uncharacterized protein n=1 Tax=Nemania bipapillata TaxID=110536 RepID=A0ACC2I1B4_9PEZI|nr:hypothetical protein ONZ43_g6326 [Nemania bipapillata]
MELFRNALNLWTRRDPQTTSNASEEPDMPLRNGISTPTRTSNPIPTSSPLSSLDTTASFSTLAANAYADARGDTDADADDTIVVASANDSRVGEITRPGHSSSVVTESEDEEEAGRRDAGGCVDANEAVGNQSDLDTAPQQYRLKKGLPPELKEHCRVYLEEALPRQAIALLDSLLSTRSENPREPVYCPPPSQISLLCSLIVHPDFTTRPKEPDWPQISLQSLVYLRGLLAVLGPVNACFKEAVLFGTHATYDADPDSLTALYGHADADERGLVRLSPRHGNDSIWQRGRDFFSVVGWAFNCSVLHLERWQWWARWLDFMLDLLEKDIQQRHDLDVESGADDMPFLQGSILASYITQRSSRTTDMVMWIIKALFSDGSASSTSVFQEIWHREHKNKSQRTANKRKREKVNIDRGEYGGYLDDESVHSSQASEPPTPQKRRTREEVEEAEVLEATYIETIPFRQRLFSLVSYLSYSLHDASPIDFSNLYQKFEQRIKELPLPIFSSFINHSTSALRMDQQIEMLQGVLFLFMPAGALSPRKVDRVRFEEGGVSPAILERCFLPYPANTIEIEDHIKMSLLLENLLMIVWENGENEGFSGNLAQAVRKGVEARWDKINKKKTRGRGRGPSEAEREARATLEASDARLGWLVAAIEDNRKTAEEDPMDEDERS